MRRFFNSAVLCVSSVFLVCSSCQTAVAPPFDVQTASERRATMIDGFGEYVMSHPKAQDVLVHREIYSSGKGLPVDFYYPPGFRFNKPVPTVIVVGGSVDWSSSVTLAELLAANNFVTVVPETLHMVKADTPSALTTLLERVMAESRRLFIDTERLAIWTEGHPSSLALQVAMDRDATFHGGLQAGGVCLAGHDICTKQLRI